MFNLFAKNLYRFNAKFIISSWLIMFLINVIKKIACYLFISRCSCKTSTLHLFVKLSTDPDSNCRRKIRIAKVKVVVMARKAKYSVLLSHTYVMLFLYEFYIGIQCNRFRGKSPELSDQYK